MKEVMIFGSTGSIGRNTLDVIRNNRASYRVKGLCAFSDIDTLTAQVKEFSPRYVCVVDEAAASIFKKRVLKKVTFFKGQDGLLDFSRLTSDISLMAISGISCLKPLLISIEGSKRIALANKESLVVAAPFVFRKAHKHTTEIIPIDSEINALFQLFKMGDSFSKIYLTASGGSLLDYDTKSLYRVRVETVLKHPTWRMGTRVTVDSATLINKGFEVVEAHHYFNVPYEKIEVVIHRESKIHAMVEYKDTTIFACLYETDMRIPISFALGYPWRTTIHSGLSFDTKLSLTFEPANLKKLPLLKMILEAAQHNDNALVILNACDEVAIDYFLKRKIKFTDMYKVMEYIFTHYPSKKISSVDEVFTWDGWARLKTKEYLDKLC